MIQPAANTRVARFVPHDRLLPDASLLVTHAGTVMTALSQWRAAPVCADGQVSVLGRVIDMDSEATALRNAVSERLGDSEARDGAKHVARLIAGYGGAAGAVAKL